MSDNMDITPQHCGVTEWMIKNGYAGHPAHAGAIYRLLHLDKLGFWRQVRRVMLYRGWRDVLGNNSRRPKENSHYAAEMAISGKHPPKKLL